MRLSASRIRSINRAIARTQSSAWTTPRNHRRLSTGTMSRPTGVNSAGTTKVVVVPRGTAQSL